MEVEAVEAGDGFERLSSQATAEMVEARQAADRMSSSMRSVGGASSTATNLTFELTQQLQDLQAGGIQGAVNAFPLMFEQFGRLQNEAGSTTGALSDLLGTFTGPTGILALGTLGLQALPMIVDFFGGIADSAKEARESVDELKSAADTLIQGFSQELPSFEITDRAQARDLQQGLQESIESREQLLEDLRAARDATGAEQAQLSAGAARFATLEEATIDRLIQKNERQVDQERALEQVLSEKLSQREKAVQQKELLNAAEGRGIKLAEDGADAQQNATDAMENQVSAAETLNRLLQRMRRTMGDMETLDAMFGPQAQQVEAAPAGDARGSGVLAPSERNVSSTMRGALERAELVGSNRELGRTGLPGTQQPGEPSALDAMSMTLSEIQEKFDVSRDKAEQFKQAAQSRFGQVAQAATSMGSALVQALDSGEKKAHDIASVLLQGVGGVLSAIPGVGTITGPVLSGVGGLVGSFQEGGTMQRTGMARLHPPEIITNVPGGAQIIGQEATQRIIESATGGTRGMGMVVQKLDELGQRMEQMELTVDTYGLVSEINRIQAEKDAFSVA